VKPTKMHVPQNLGALRDLLSMILLSAPKFSDETRYFPHRDLDYVFQQLLAGLSHNRAALGLERYHQMMEMSDRMRALFETDPDGKTGDTAQGYKIIHEMEDILTEIRRNRATDDKIVATVCGLSLICSIQYPGARYPTLRFAAIRAR
jgi:hypothetical protein